MTSALKTEERSVIGGLISEFRLLMKFEEVTKVGSVGKFWLLNV